LFVEIDVNVYEFNAFNDYNESVYQFSGRFEIVSEKVGRPMSDDLPLIYEV